MLVLSPHPDDETLGCGGLLAAQRRRDIPVTLVAVTDGEHAYQDNVGLAERRTREQAKAAQRLGIPCDNIVRLHLTDSNVAAQCEDLIDQVEPFVDPDTHILAPWLHDFHPDHEACGLAAQELSRRTGARLTFYFFWTWHHATPDFLHGLELSSFPLTRDLQHIKAEALACHDCQLNYPSGDPVLHEMHLWPARLPFEIYVGS